MNTKIFTEKELIENPIIAMQIENQLWNLLGIKFNHKIVWYRDAATNSIVVKYE